MRSMRVASKLQIFQLMQQAIKRAGGKFVSQAVMDSVMEAFAVAACSAIKQGYTVDVPHLVRIRPIPKPPKPAYERMNYFNGKVITVAAKPARSRIKLTTRKGLRDVVAT